jgi:Predicted redox protein, regulator of disulfide bond formation
MIKVDARGHHCPVPSLRLRKAMASAGPAAEIELIATDPMARIDIPHLLGQIGGSLRHIREADGVLIFHVVTPGVPQD